MNNKQSLEKEMREAIHVFLQDNSPASLIRELHEKQDIDLNPLWQEIHNMGLGIIMVPDSLGGIGLGVSAAVDLAQEIGMSLLPLPLSTCVILAPLLFSNVSDAKQKMLVKEIYQGKHSISLFHDLGDNKQRADYVNEASIGVSINNEAINLVSYDHMDVRYGIDKSIAFVIADKRDITKQETLCNITTSQAVILQNMHRLMLMGELLGVALHSLKLAIDYACEREQFGKAIGVNQALKHNLANRWMEIDNARLAIYKAVDSLEETSESISFDLDVAQYLIIQAGKSVTSYAKQVYGAMGVTWECDIHLYLKRSRYLCALLEQNNSKGTILNNIWDCAV